jgi:hypothetical protein
MRDGTGRFDDPSYLSPFAEELYSGYSRFQYLDDGSWFEMLKPGASGVGLHVGQLFAPECCCGYYSQASDVAVWKDGFNPWLYPSVVTWQSVMMPRSTHPHPDYVRTFAVDYPAVALTHVRSSVDDFRWSLNNLNYEIDTDRFIYEPNEEPVQLAGTEVIGVVPIWAVSPLFSEDKKIGINNFVQKLRAQTNLGLLSECWCSIDGAPCDDDCATQTSHNKECTCQTVENLATELENLYNDPVTVEDYLDSNTKTIWDYAVGRFYDGWQIIHDTAFQGEPWASYWQHAQSPFSALPGQNFRDQLESTSLISSVTQQAS